MRRPDARAALSDSNYRIRKEVESPIDYGRTCALEHLCTRTPAQSCARPRSAQPLSLPSRSSIPVSPLPNDRFDSFDNTVAQVALNNTSARSLTVNIQNNESYGTALSHNGASDKGSSNQARWTVTSSRRRLQSSARTERDVDGI
jgi:hypothetical protein